MTDRETLIGEFLGAHGWAGGGRRPLAGDASFRRYHRLEERQDQAVAEDTPGGVRRAVLMDAPPPEEDVGPFARMDRHLISLGYSAPEILAEDLENGFLLLEDMGDDTYTRVLAEGGPEGADEHALYALAVDLLIDLHRRPREEAVPRGLPPYGNGRLLDEAFLLPQWTLPAFTGGPLPEDARRAYGDAWLAVFPRVSAQPKTLVLRDYHVDNLMWLPGRPGIKACGLLDFQDAVCGPGAYDLMSLLQDARRDMDGSLVKEMFERYAAAFPAMDRPEFEAVFAILAAQRHAKVIGIFTRLCVRDGKPDYLAHIPRVWRLLEKALEHPALTGVRKWFDRHVPAQHRIIPTVANRGKNLP